MLVQRRYERSRTDSNREDGCFGIQNGKPYARQGEVKIVEKQSPCKYCLELIDLICVGYWAV